MSNQPELSQLRLGIVPLSDCAPLVVAKRKGLFTRHGLEVELSIEPSWANIRDKVAVGELHGAQMLATMPIAMTLGLGPVETPMITALSLGLNGNAITVSRELHAHMLAADRAAATQRPISARSLKGVIDARGRQGLPPLTFAHVFPISTHGFALRYWLASAGINPDRDVRLVVIPPPQMADSLRDGSIDGFCVGEPWNSAAVSADAGHTLITSYELWNNHPEKVFAVAESWARSYPMTHASVLRALIEAAAWCDEAANRAEVAQLVSEVIALDEAVVARSLTNRFRYEENAPAVDLPDFHVFSRYSAGFPWRSHAEWFISQMLRWGQINRPLDVHATAQSVFRPDLYRQAAAELGVATPTADRKTEGAHTLPWRLETDASAIAMGPDHFFDGERFDPDALADYMQSFAVHSRARSGSSLAPSGR